MGLSGGVSGAKRALGFRFSAAHGATDRQDLSQCKFPGFHTSIIRHRQFDQGSILLSEFHLAPKRESSCTRITFSGRSGRMKLPPLVTRDLQSAPRPPSLTGAGVRKCSKAACSLITAAAWVRRLPLLLLKSRVVTVCSQKVHLNVVPPFIGLVV